MEYTLRVQVKDVFTLDAGTLVADDPRAGRDVVVRPPAVPMFDQVLSWLDEYPDVSPVTRRPADLAKATVATCLGWGSWLALLCDPRRERPEHLVPEISRIHDPEMARINVEASAALEQWLEIRRVEPDRFWQLVTKAVRWLPAMPDPGFDPEETARLRALAEQLDVEPPPLVDTTIPEHTSPYRASALTRAWQAGQPEYFAERQAEVTAHPTRVLANALINATFRNGPVESVHAGRAVDFPLDCRRVTLDERSHLLQRTVTQMLIALPAIDAMIEERGRSWPDKVMPFHLLSGDLVTPHGWTLTARSWEIAV